MNMVWCWCREGQWKREVSELTQRHPKHVNELLTVDAESIDGAQKTYTPAAPDIVELFRFAVCLQSRCHRTLEQFLTDSGPTRDASMTESQNVAEQKALTAVTRVTRACHYCRQQFSSLKYCARCRAASYCGTECQRKDWRCHRKVCGR